MLHLAAIERLCPVRAIFVPVVMARDARCDCCGESIDRGTSAKVVLDDGDVGPRRVRCEACFDSGAEPPRERVVMPVAAPERPADLARVSPPIVALASVSRWQRTFSRALVTLLVATKISVFSLLDRVRGRRDDAPRLVRRAFEDLGPTYIKLGQLIASSEGLFPERYCQELKSCLDRVPPFPFAQVEATLRAELGRDPAEVFASIEETPIASASIAQVHAARLLDGTEVVIKVQRPGLRDVIDADLSILRVLCSLLSLFPDGELAGPRDIVDDFEQNLSEELDFLLEAANMDAFNRIMEERGHPDVAAPRVHHELTSRRVLVMERFFGHRVDDVQSFRDKSLDGEAQLLLGMRAWFQCLIFHGFFHGDVHAGNLMSLDDGRIGFLDFGIVGRFTLERRIQITDYLMSFASADFRRLAEVMMAMGTVDVSVDIDKLSSDLKGAYEPILGDASGAAKYADLIPVVMRLSRKHRMRLPREFVLVTKQMLYFDRYAKLLAPDVNVFRDPRVVAGLVEDVMGAQLARMTAEVEGTP